VARPRRRQGHITVGRGRPRDAAAICELIRGLARYERLERQCVIGPAAIRRHGFGRRRYFETLICRRDGRPIGLPEERGAGAGRALLRALARIAVRRGCGRMEWTVLDWNTPSIRFYRRLGAELRREWLLTRLTGPALRRLAAGDARRG